MISSSPAVERPCDCFFSRAYTETIKKLLESATLKLSVAAQSKRPTHIERCAAEANFADLLRKPHKAGKAGSSWLSEAIRGRCYHPLTASTAPAHP